MTTAYIGLGSNMGDCSLHLSQAYTLIAAENGLEVESISPIYLTEPQGIKDQAWFHNQVMRLKCSPAWTAQKLLVFLQSIEQSLGRVRSLEKNMQNGPRCIDLDLLLFGANTYTDPLCQVPHPRMTQRAFVLIPLRDVARQDILPFDIEYCLKNIEYKLDGQKIYQG